MILKLWFLYTQKPDLPTCKSTDGIVESSPDDCGFAATHVQFDVSKRTVVDTTPSTTPSRPPADEPTYQDKPCYSSNGNEIRATVPYPAPLPKFPKAVEDVLRGDNKTKVMSIYAEVIKNAATFYSSFIPTETSKAKVSMTNIGRSMIERYPALATGDRTSPWSFFNSKLSTALRNDRSRIKHKLELPGGGCCNKVGQSCPYSRS